MRTRFTKVVLTPGGLVILAAMLLGVIMFAAAERAKQINGAPVPYAAPQLMAAKAGAMIERFTPADSSAVAQAAPPAAEGIIPLPPVRRGRGPSQLIRTASVRLEVADVEKALKTAAALTDEQLGDVIGLDDDSPTSPVAAHTATMEIRVPQYRFDQTLDALGALGKVRSRSVSAQDVSDQIVDASARLRNLRRTEADILNIMDRSGNIEQVLDVTQQLGNVREQIERLDAQIQGMQYQVAYSTINITFVSPVVVATPHGFGLLAGAWKNALSSLRDVTVGILSLALWLVAFSPYILLAALLAAFALHRVRASSAAHTRGSTV
jgi:Domain of unknown function (DUF4349)